jgi:hypothetical protein
MNQEDLDRMKAALLGLMDDPALKKYTAPQKAALPEGYPLMVSPTATEVAQQLKDQKARLARAERLEAINDEQAIRISQLEEELAEAKEDLAGYEEANGGPNLQMRMAELALVLGSVMGELMVARKHGANTHQCIISRDVLDELIGKIQVLTAAGNLGPR